MLFDLNFGMFAGITIFLLEQAREDIESTRYLVQVVIGEFAPPDLGFSAHLFPLAYEYIFIHEFSFGSFENAVLMYAGARGSMMCRFSNSD